MWLSERVLTYHMQGPRPRLWFAEYQKNRKKKERNQERKEGKFLSKERKEEIQ